MNLGLTRRSQSKKHGEQKELYSSLFCRRRVCRYINS